MISYLQSQVGPALSGRTGFCRCLTVQLYNSFLSYETGLSSICIPPFLNFFLYSSFPISVYYYNPSVDKICTPSVTCAIVSNSIQLRKKHLFDLLLYFHCCLHIDN